MGEFVRDLLLSQGYFETILARIPKKILDEVLGTLQELGLSSTPVGNAGQGGPDRRGGDDGRARPASVKASLSVAMGQRAPNRAGVTEDVAQRVSRREDMGNEGAPPRRDTLRERERPVHALERAGTHNDRGNGRGNGYDRDSGGGDRRDSRRPPMSPRDRAPDRMRDVRQADRDRDWDRGRDGGRDRGDARHRGGLARDRRGPDRGDERGGDGRGWRDRRPPASSVFGRSAADVFGKPAEAVAAVPADAVHSAYRGDSLQGTNVASTIDQAEEVVRIGRRR